MTPCLSYYGGYRTRTFADVYNNVDTFTNEIWEIATGTGATSYIANITYLKQLYYLLYARYGNSHIAFSDETQFKFSLFSNIYMYSADWQKRLEIQKKLRDMPENELVLGGKAIYNKAYNPATQPSTATLEELTTINEQNTTNYKKSKIEGYSLLLSLLEKDFTEDFLRHFKNLFITVVAPDYPLLYKTYPDNTSEEEVSLYE